MGYYCFRVFPKNHPFYETNGNGLNFAEAKTNVARREGVSESNVQYLREIKEEKSSSNSSFNVGDVGSAGGLVILLGGAWLLVSFMPWVLMLVGGTAGAWVSEKISGQSLEDLTDNEGSTKKIAFILASSVILGGVGFVQGTQWQKELNNPEQPQVENVQPQKNN
tara:strand:- start:77 stop:571 length:495 start_codon:yes stop_codon:yes gene_type:complete